MNIHPITREAVDHSIADAKNGLLHLCSWAEPFESALTAFEAAPHKTPELEARCREIGYAQADKG